MASGALDSLFLPTHDKSTLGEFDVSTVLAATQCPQSSSWSFSHQVCNAEIIFLRLLLLAGGGAQLQA